MQLGFSAAYSLYGSNSHAVDGTYWSQTCIHGKVTFGNKYKCTNNVKHSERNIIMN